MKLAHCHTDWNTQLHRRGYRPRLLLKRLCLGKESYLSLLRITPDVELLPLYNQRHNMVATWLKTNNMPLNDWKTTRTKPTKNSKVTRLLRFNANLTAHYWHSRRQTPLTPNTTIDSGTQYHSHRNFTVCRNYTNLVSQCDQLFLSVVLRHTNCLSTWRQYYNRSPTNPDVNYNPPRTSLTPLRLYRYLTTTN